jgi:hypothetical protein
MQGKYAHDDSFQPRPDIVADSIGDLRFFSEDRFYFSASRDFHKR